MKETSTEPSDWWRRRIDEALGAAPLRVEEPPPLAYPQSPASGVDDLFEILVVIESFGLPEPSRDRIEYATLLL